MRDKRDMPLTRDEADQEAARIRDTSAWPVSPWLPVKRPGETGSELGLLFADDVSPPELNSQAVGCIRVFAATDATAAALIRQSLIPGGDLAVIAQYESVETLIAGGWQAD
jgi:hypothetical protein